MLIAASLTFISTLCGGLFALRYQDRLHLILGFTAGVLLGVVSFDLLPEIMRNVADTQLHVDPMGPMLTLVAGFLLFHVVERALVLHHAQESAYAAHVHPAVGIVSALALAGHSFMDGLGIGLSFQVSPSLGVVVAVAVVGHDFADGLNTVTLMLTHGNPSRRAFVLLMLDALTPLLGVAVTFFFHVSPAVLVLYLGFFAGFLLYIGASDILPEAHRTHSSLATIALTIAGTVAMFLITRVV